MTTSKYPTIQFQPILTNNYIGYLVIDISGLKKEQSTYRNSSLTCSVTLGGKSYGDLSLARTSHSLTLPLTSADEKLQLNIYPMTNSKNRIGKVIFDHQPVYE